MRKDTLAPIGVTVLAVTCCAGLPILAAAARGSRRLSPLGRLTQALSRAQRISSRTALFFVDIDHFKQVNDTRGHAEGNAVLRRVGEQLSRAMRPMDTVSRIGGDEFVVLTPELRSHIDAIDIGRRLLEVVRGSPEEDGEGEAITVSVGISVTTDGRSDAERMLHEADSAMYHAKSLGRNRAEIFDESHTRPTSPVRQGTFGYAKVRHGEEEVCNRGGELDRVSRTRRPVKRVKLTGSTRGAPRRGRNR